ncbi:hypothetical protein ElyMa_002952400 [Elysia marginata]|uniref:Uncharacterized protein n=1 Tax=Elysia marginata TaxID=1093978 RepID=A0AAV4I6Q5_9GAST|nr:hypothetical protein ElyMa_002952400 [Elysia marginata]
MNWVGGVRRRITVSSRKDRKIQKEFFERKRLNAETAKLGDHDSKLEAKNKPTAPKQGSKVSQDLLAFHFTRKSGQNRGSREQANFRVLDLGKKKTTPGMAMVAGRCVQAVDLPLSPPEIPSVLNLSSPARVSTGSRDATKSGDKNQPWFTERPHDDTPQMFSHKIDVNHRKNQRCRTAFCMDLLGEKVPVPMAKPSRERTHQQRDEPYLPGQTERAVCGYQTDLASRYGFRQGPRHDHYDADSEVSDLLSSFSQRQRSSDKTSVLASNLPPTQATWWAHNEEQSFFSHPEPQVDYINRTQSAQPQKGSSHETAVQELLEGRKLKSTMMPFNFNSSENKQPYSSPGNAESPSPATALSSLFARPSPFYQINANERQKYIFEKAPAPTYFLSDSVQIHSTGKENSLSGNKNRFKENFFNDNISSLFNMEPPRSHSSKAWAADTRQNKVLSFTSDQENRTYHGEAYQDKDRAICKRKSPNNCDGNSLDKWGSDGDSYQNDHTMCHTPVAPTGKSTERPKQASTPTASSPDIGGSSGYSDCLSNQRYWKPRPRPDTVSTFSVSRKHRASSPDNVYLEICNLENQVSQQKEQTLVIEAQTETNATSKGMPMRQGGVDSDVLIVVNQMIDCIAMEETVCSAQERAMVKKAIHLPVHDLPSMTGLLTKSQKQICDSSSLSPIDSYVMVQEEKLNSNAVLSKGIQVEPTLLDKSVQSEGSEASRPELVDAACSPIRQACHQYQSQQRYNTRRHAGGHHFSSNRSLRPSKNQREHKRISAKAKKPEMGKEANKMNDSEQLHLTQPED